MPLPALEELSDDDAPSSSRINDRTQPAPSRALKRKGPLNNSCSKHGVNVNFFSNKRISYLVDSRQCGCKKKTCFHPFREESKFRELQAMRKQMSTMNKIDQDRYVSTLMSFLVQSCSSYHGCILCCAA